MTAEAARAAAEAVHAGSGAMRLLGIEVLEAGPGSATLAMTVTPAMTTAHGTAFGGVIFSLADAAFAVACNSYGELTVAAHCAISFLRPGQVGDRMTAIATEVTRSRRSGIYDVRVMAAGRVIAEFRGHSRTLGGPVDQLPPRSADA